MKKIFVPIVYGVLRSMHLLFPELFEAYVMALLRVNGKHIHKNPIRVKRGGKHVFYPIEEDKKDCGDTAALNSLSGGIFPGAGNVRPFPKGGDPANHTAR